MVLLLLRLLQAQEAWIDVCVQILAAKFCSGSHSMYSMSEPSLLRFAGLPFVAFFGAPKAKPGKQVFDEHII